MKKYVFITLLIAVTANLYAQKEKKHYIGCHYSHGIANYSKSIFKSFDHEEYEAKDYSIYGFDYAFRKSETTELCIGLSLTLFQLDMKYTYISKIGTDTSYYDERFGIISVPVHLKYHFWKYFYVNPGLSLNYHPSHGYTWGVGGFAGVGAEYTFASGLCLSVAPQVQLNILSSGKRDENDMNFSGFEDKLMLIGGKIGIGYKF